MINHLSKPNSIRGYHSIGRIEWSERDIMPNRQYPFDIIHYKGQQIAQTAPAHYTETPYCFTEIMETEKDVFVCKISEEGIKQGIDMNYVQSNFRLFEN